MDVVINQTDLPNSQFQLAWDAIHVSEMVKNRLLAQSLLALQIRSEFSFEEVPIHGLILLAGAPGTGKTTLARGLAQRIANSMDSVKTTFIQIDPHALASSALGKSQREMTKLFQQRIPELAIAGPCVVLLDEIETLVVDRQSLSLEANPIDVHRSTDAALAGLDILARDHRNVMLIATTNFISAVDEALLSRADWIETIPLPDADARTAIIKDVLELLHAQYRVRPDQPDRTY